MDMVQINQLVGELDSFVWGPVMLSSGRYGCLHDTEAAFPDLEKSAIRIKNDLFEEVSHDQGRKR